MFVDAKTDRVATVETPSIIAKTKRLLSIYGENHSSNNYVNRLVGFLHQGTVFTRFYLEAPPIPLPHGYEMPIELRIDLEQLVVDKHLLSAN